jgi:hypothetical protein
MPDGYLCLQVPVPGALSGYKLPVWMVQVPVVLAVNPNRKYDYIINLCTHRNMVVYCKCIIDAFVVEMKS